MPENDRWGKGPALTDTDIGGFYRVRAAAIALFTGQAAQEPSPEEVDDVRRAAVSGMVRRENEEKHNDNLDLIRYATQNQTEQSPI